MGYWEDRQYRSGSAPGCAPRSVSWRAAISALCVIADNMRNVAVTEGDKVEAQIKFGWEVDAYPVNEIAEAVEEVGQGRC
ncbi:MAG: hypothetical protein ACLR2O_12055 [Coprococcus sp.]